jgi:hypothetical protein
MLCFSCFYLCSVRLYDIQCWRRIHEQLNRHTVHHVPFDYGNPPHHIYPCVVFLADHDVLSVEERFDVADPALGDVSTVNPRRLILSTAL